MHMTSIWKHADNTHALYKVQQKDAQSTQLWKSAYLLSKQWANYKVLQCYRKIK